MKLNRLENKVSIELSTVPCQGDGDYLAILVNGLCSQREFYRRKGWNEMAAKAQDIINVIAQ